jgi:ketosteroid isomerase-like protein
MNPPAPNELVAMERELAAGDGETYKRLLAEDATVIVPGQVLGKEATADAIDAAGGWDRFAIEDEVEVQLTDDVALITYRFTGARGDFEYDAQLTSVYRRDPDGRRHLVLHQQTPSGAPDG